MNRNYGSFVDADYMHRPQGSPAAFYGKEEDLGLLPNTVASGSTAYCMDSKKLYMFEETTKQWILQ